ncbi:34885_t:CDS:1, partial [Racocetra persica]
SDIQEINILDLIASDTETRWNSTFFLLERLIYFCDTLSVLANKLASNPNRTTRSDSDDLKKLLLNSEDWTLLDELILLLRSFVDTTNLTSGSSYPTLSLWYPTLHCLREYLNNILQTITSSQIRTVCTEILASLYKHWDIPDELDCIASFLDPRFKFLNFLSPLQRENIKQNLKNRIELLETSNTLSTTTSSNNTSLFIDFFNQNSSSQPSTSQIDIKISLYLQLPALA